MVNIQGSVRMMLSRYLELLRSRIQCAPTRHIADRHLREPFTSGQYLKQVKERDGAGSYNKNKRRSMWEQSDSYGERFSDQEDNRRVDFDQYRPKELEERKYNYTWTDFPENMEVRQCNLPPIEEEAPQRRRSPENRPNTAKPFDDDAAAFIEHCRENNTAIMTRRQHVRFTASTPQPVVNHDVGYGPGDRKRQFHY